MVSDRVGTMLLLGRHLEVEQWLRSEIGQRDINVTSDEWLADQADVVRTGRPIRASDPTPDTCADDDTVTTIQSDVDE